MDYDKSDIAAIYDEARVITSERLRQWQEVLSTQLDRTAISVVVDLGCGTGRFTESLATHFGAQVIGIVNCICSPGRESSPVVAVVSVVPPRSNWRVWARTSSWPSWIRPTRNARRPKCEPSTVAPWSC